MTDLKDLIARLESAAEGSRELSDEWLLAMGWRVQGSHRYWAKPDNSIWMLDDRPCPSTNLQDTVDAVSEGFYWSIDYGPDGYMATLREVWKDGAKVFVGNIAATPALALSAAIARAKMEEE